MCNKGVKMTTQPSKKTTIQSVQSVQPIKQVQPVNANTEVPTEVAKKINSLSSLVTGEGDVMTIHTQEAFRLFNGVAQQDGGYYVPGARRAASELRRLFILSYSDNPYADQFLVRADNDCAKLAKLMQEIENAELAKLKARAARGTSYSILEAEKPQGITLGMKSPYGFMLTNLMVDFDYLVRVLRTSERRDLITRNESKLLLEKVKHGFRSLFSAAIRTGPSLIQPEVVGICRHDFLPTASENSVKKREAAKELLGEIDASILLCEVEPRHTLRRYPVKADELKVLKKALEEKAQEELVVPNNPDLED